MKRVRIPTVWQGSKAHDTRLWEMLCKLTFWPLPPQGQKLSPETLNSQVITTKV